MKPYVIAQELHTRAASEREHVADAPALTSGATGRAPGVARDALHRVPPIWRPC